MLVSVCMCPLLDHVFCGLARQHGARSLLMAGHWGQLVMTVRVGEEHTEGLQRVVNRTRADPTPAEIHTHTHTPMGSGIS